MKNLIFVYIGYLLLASIHEAGHYLAGRACGFKILEFRVGIFRWEEAPGWGLTWKWPEPFSGAVKGVPNKPDRWLRFRFLLFILAGPAFNILAGVAVLGPTDRSTLNGTLALLSMASILMGLLNLLPMRKGKRKSDGFQIVDAIFGGQNFRRVRFAVTFLDSATTIRDLMHTEKWNEVKTLCEKLLAPSRNLTQDEGTDKIVSSLTAALELAHRNLTIGPAALEAALLPCEPVQQASAITG